MTKALTSRNKKIRALRKKGLSLRATGRVFNISYERVRQICAPVDKLGLTEKDLGTKV